MVAVTARACGSTFLNSRTGVPSMPVNEIRYTRAAASAPHAAATGPSTHFTRSLADTFVDRHFANALRSRSADAIPSASTDETSPIFRDGECFCRTFADVVPTTRPLLQTNRNHPTAARRGTVPSTELKHSNVNAIR